MTVGIKQYLFLIWHIYHEKLNIRFRVHFIYSPRTPHERTPTGNDAASPVLTDIANTVRQLWRRWVDSLYVHVQRTIRLLPITQTYTCNVPNVQVHHNLLAYYTKQKYHFLNVSKCSLTHFLPCNKCDTICGLLNLKIQVKQLLDNESKKRVLLQICQFNRMDIRKSNT